MKEDKILNMVAVEKEATIRAIQAQIKARREKAENKTSKRRTLKDVTISDTTSELSIDPTKHTEGHFIAPESDEEWIEVKEKKG